MELLLTNDVCSLSADELVAYVRMSFNADKYGYVYGSNKDFAVLAGMSVPRVKKAIEGLFERQMVSLGNAKLFIWKHESTIRYSQDEQPVEHQESMVGSVSLTVASTKKEADESQSVCDYFNRVIEGKGMAQIRALTPKRKSAINARIREYGIEQVYAMIDNAAASSFLNESSWASFDWIFRPNNFVKVLEGNYGNRQKATNKSAEQQYYDNALELTKRLYSKRKTED